MEHKCPEFGFSDLGWTLENKGDGWYMYNKKGERSKASYNFCPSCGEKLGEEKDSIREALESMVWQFAYRGVKNGRPVLYGVGGTLKGAFIALGWDNPKYFEDMDGPICDVEGCMEWTVSGGIYWHGTGYWHLCNNHHEVGRKGKPQPKMKQRAIDRESKRDPNTGILPMEKEDGK